MSSQALRKRCLCLKRPSVIKLKEQYCSKLSNSLLAIEGLSRETCFSSQEDENFNSREGKNV